MFIHSRSSLESHTRFQTKMGKVYTRLQTKTAQKPHNGTKHTYIAYIREYPPPPGCLRASDLGYLGCLICLRRTGFCL